VNAKRATEKADWVDILLAAALAAWGTVCCATFVFGLMPTMVSSPERIVSKLYWFVLGYGFFGFVLATVVCTIVGLPALALATWLKLSKWWQGAIVGGAAGLLVSLAIPAWPGLAYLDQAMSVVLFAIAGAFAGVAAWREHKKGIQSS
jgi:hypothetical protein